MVRTPGFDRSGLKKGTWTPEEDRKLVAYVTRYGCWNWRQLPKFAGLSRCGKSCRLRWMNYLRPNIKRGNYTREEEETIIKLHGKLGNRWSAIAAHLQGRTDNEIKNHWHTNLKKRVVQQNLDEANCGKSNTQEESKETSESNSEQTLQTRNESDTETDSNSNQVLLINPETDHQTLDTSSMTENANATSNRKETVVDNYEQLLNVNFWTEPFMEEEDTSSYYIPYDTLATEFVDPLYEGEFLTTFSSYDNYPTLFY